jgi:putative endopeptidase
MSAHTRKKGGETPPEIYFKKNIYPGNDFYQYVNGNWLDHAHLPATAHSAGISNTIQNKVDKCLLISAKKLMNNAASKSNGLLSLPQRAAIRTILTQTKHSIDNFSHNYSANLITMQRLFSQVKSISTKEDIPYMIGYLNAYQVPNVINIGTSQDIYDRNYQVVKFFMGDYSLGDKQYYWNRDFGTTELFDVYEKYLKHMGHHFQLEELEALPKLERKAVRLYNEVAGKSENSKLWKKTAIIEKFPILKSLFNALHAICPSIEWSSIEYSIDKTATMHFLNRCIEEFPIEQWKIWFYGFILNYYAPYTSPWTAKEHHILFGKTMTGLPELRKGDEKWLEVLKNFAPIVLNEFSRNYCINLQRRQEIRRFFNRIQKSTIDILNETEWLDPPTRKRAVEKVNELNIDIGFPKGSYHFPLVQLAASLNSEDLIQNIMELNRADFEYGIKSVYSLNHTPWDNPVFVVNAHYWDYENRIFFPGAILEAPNFLVGKKKTRKARRNPATAHRLAWNYGNLGATLGHEITHAFDVEGMKVNQDGLKHTWATKDDQSQYKKKVEKLEKVFKKVRQDGLKLDTPYIISEAIADLGGLSIALHALKKEIDGLGWSNIRKQEEIRWFFIAYAYSWQQKMRPMARVRRVYVDEHPPAWTRVNYIVNQFTEWYEAFGVRGGSLYLPPEERVQFFTG